MKSIRQVIRDVPMHWVGDGFPVRSLFTYNHGPGFDPFLLLDYAGPHQFAPTEAKQGVGGHPHRGFETVTIVYQGELEHRDSSGSQGSIGAGDVQWMTAAAGIVHEEFHSRRFAREGGTLEMVQLWVNLPARDKNAPAGYQELRDADIPRVELPQGAGTVRVIAGDFQGTSGAARTFTPINAWDLMLEADGTADLTVSADHNCLLVVQSGDAEVNGQSLKSAELAVFDRDGDRITIKAASPTRLLLLSGEPIEEPIAGQGPFVMNTREEIQQALRDFQAGRMGQLS